MLAALVTTLGAHAGSRGTRPGRRAAGGRAVRRRLAAARPRLPELARHHGLEHRREPTSRRSRWRGRRRCPGRGGVRQPRDHAADRRRHDLHRGSVEHDHRDRPRDRCRALDERSTRGFVIGPNGVALGWGKVFAIRGTERVVALDASTRRRCCGRAQLINTPTRGRRHPAHRVRRPGVREHVPVSLNGIYKGGDRGIAVRAAPVRPARSRGRSTPSSRRTCGATPTSTRAAAPGIRRRSTPAAAASSGASPTRRRFPAHPGSRTAPAVPGRISTPTRWSRSTSASGALDWFQQAIPHDIFDHDLIHSLLVDVRAGQRHAAHRASRPARAARSIGHDIDSGATLWTTPVGIHQNDDLTALDRSDRGAARHLRRRADAAGGGRRRGLRRDPQRAEHLRARPFPRSSAATSAP